MTNLAARSLWRRTPNWRQLADRLFLRLTQDSAELDAAREAALRLAAENAALTAGTKDLKTQVKRLQARNQELWDTVERMAAASG